MLKLSQARYVSGEESTVLHTVDVWQPEGSTDIESGVDKVWLIYIHGGAWRDPLVDSKSFGPAVNELWNSSSKTLIAGFASINYRLSPYPDHPELPSSPEDPSRNVHYPSHVSDIEQALLYLEDQYRINDRYLLVGHSAGATMALELQKGFLPTPIAVLGIAGIYDFEGLIKAHSHPAYREFMESAFPDRSLWKKAAPYTNFSPDNLYEIAKVVIISYSDDDELVETRQATSMLERIASGPLSKEQVHVLKASGNHDEIWGSGTILAGIITKSLDIIQALT